MQPFLEEIHIEQGQEVARSLVGQLQVKDPKSALVGLCVTAVLAADAAQVPLESVFQLMRDCRARFQAQVIVTP